ncbi:LPXTG cell wall anchor domain-containing protein [Enterococcus sp. BWR-S5]|uniref:LPXTG cell wall anchor domain-containing protein n=1 Tax=Enterococcus sp. BWR-S5 TaxID=2787714 RepID=UPI001921B7E1|nr:LPXTG cell wall anchor domain-containing protein [Enterococcus sp. BWR-S5]MBL1226683.1 LPXTG cell wall anchor domain-containing protein [Enterococcus sp. BWR-S5]
MKKRLASYLLPVVSFLLVGYTLGGGLGYVEATGGVVSTKGQIRLTDTTETSSSSTDSSDTSSTNSSDSSNTSGSNSIGGSSNGGGNSLSGVTGGQTTGDGSVSKPAGSKYPSTGELVKTSLSISGGLLIVLALFFYIWKRKKEREARG